jgi:hypothetical protein
VSNFYKISWKFEDYLKNYLEYLDEDIYFEFEKKYEKEYYKKINELNSLEEITLNNTDN